MQLREYWQIIFKRIGVVIGTFVVAVVAAAASVFLIPQVAAPYQASLTLAVLPKPEAVTGPYYRYDGYYAYVSSEYLNDDLIAIVQTSDFLQAVRARIKNFPGGPPTGSLEGKKAHRIVTITASSPTSAGALALARGVGALLTSTAAQTDYFSKFAPEIPTISVVNQPEIIAGPAGRSALLNVAARSLVGLAIGLGLAFLLEYLDDSVDVADVRGLLEWPILGEIPGSGVPSPRKK